MINVAPSPPAHILSQTIPELELVLLRSLDARLTAGGRNSPPLREGNLRTAGNALLVQGAVPKLPVAVVLQHPAEDDWPRKTCTTRK